MYSSLVLLLQNAEMQPSLEAVSVLMLVSYRGVVNYMRREPRAARFLRQENRPLRAQINSFLQQHKKRVDRTNLAALKGET